MLSILPNYRTNLKPTRTSKTNINFKGKENLIKVSPSILAADFVNLERDIAKVEKAGADWLHVDVMEGHFVPNITIGMPVTKAIKKITSLPLDVHLMISNPEKYVNEFKEAGADIITFHYEAVQRKFLGISSRRFLGVSSRKIRKVIEEIKSKGMKAGIAINPETKAKKIFKFLPDVDQVLVMTVKPGFGGQKFIEECVQKIAAVSQKAKKIGKKDLIIEVDGGINEKTAAICREEGANAFVAGNYVYTNTTQAGIKAAIDSLRG